MSKQELVNSKILSPEEREEIILAQKKEFNEEGEKFRNAYERWKNFSEKEEYLMGFYNVNKFIIPLNRFKINILKIRKLWVSHV